MKRVLDIAAALAGLVLLSPLLAGLALAVRLESHGPALHWSQRVGRKNRLFAMPKFRTMRVGAPEVATHLLADPATWITPLGRFLRRTSLDELPQLLNVLKGDMSLVGPRPDVPAQRANYTAADWNERCSVRPGITGLAQARLRSQATPAQRLALDLQYVRECSLALDLRILGWTLARVGGQGSN